MDISGIDPAAVKTGFEAVNAAIQAIKSGLLMFRSDPEKLKKATGAIELAERELRLAEAQLAHALGYPLCKAHFPPMPMLKNRVDPEEAIPIYRCPTCEMEEPSPERFAQQRRFADSVNSHNAGLGDWMGN